MASEEVFTKLVGGKLYPNKIVSPIPAEVISKAMSYGYWMKEQTHEVVDRDFAMAILYIHVLELKQQVKELAEACLKT
jgi:hypothetical protein